MALQESDILVYTTKVCPYCHAAKGLLNQKGVKFKEIDVSDPVERLALIEKAKGRKTVPQIFIKNQHIGGYDDLKALDDRGELDPLLL